MADTALIFSIIARDKTKAGFDQVKAGAAVAGAAVGALLMAGVATAIEKGKLDAKLSAQLGATAGQAKEIGKLSGQVYAAGFGEDMPAVSAAIKGAAQNGLVSLDKISSQATQATVKNLLTVGTVLEEDSARVSMAVSQMLRTGLAKSSEEAMDILVTATQRGVNKSGDLLDTVNEYGTQFRKVGLDGKSAMGLISQAMQAGARDSDTVADAIKEFSIRAVDGSKLSSEGFKALGLDAQKMTALFARGGEGAAEGLDTVLGKLKEMKDPVAQQAAAVALFGTKAEDLGASLFAMDLDTADDQMKGLKGSTDAAAKTAAAGTASWTTLGRQFQMGLVDTLNKALPAVNAVFGFMQRNSSWVQPLAIGLGALALVLGIVTAVTWAWNAALAVNPVTWIVLGIVALIAVIVLVATKTRFFQTIWNAVWGFLKTVGTWVKTVFVGYYTWVWNKIVSGAKWVWGMVSAYFGFWYGMFNKVKGWVGSAIGWITTKWNGLVAFIKGIPGKIAGSLRNLFSPLWQGFKSFVNRIIAGWNNLSFGIPGFSFAGISVPGVSIGTPNIPYLARGAGTVTQEGLAYIHRGERVTPAARVTPYRSSSEGGGGTITLRSDGSRLSNLLLEILREAIRDRGGDPVKVLTPR